MKNLIEKIEKDLILLVREIEKAGLNTETRQSVFAYASSELENLKEEINDIVESINGGSNDYNYDQNFYKIVVYSKNFKN